ncbi:MAG: thioredoxin family protein [Terracidiphilus sp.]
MKVQILGTGCARCQQLSANAEKAIQGLGVEAQIEKVTEIKEILKFQILMTPGLAINGKVKSAGRVPEPAEIREMLLEEGGN